MYLFHIYIYIFFNLNYSSYISVHLSAHLCENTCLCVYTFFLEPFESSFCRHQGTCQPAFSKNKACLLQDHYASQIHKEIGNDS